jgi:phage terminase small subunit
MSGLTPKQEAFAQAVAAGKSMADAYRQAYDCSRSKDSTIYPKASRLMAEGKVKARLAQLRQPAADAAGMTLETHLRDLQILRNKAVKAGQISAAVQAEIARGRAAGVLAAERKQVELTGKDGGPVQVESTVDVSACTDEELRVLARLPVRARPG